MEMGKLTASHINIESGHSAGFSCLRREGPFLSDGERIKVGCCLLPIPRAY